MKRTLCILFVLIVMVVSVSASTKIKMELWNRWTYQTENGNLGKNEMALKRGYFRLEPTFGSKIKGRFNLDFFSDDKANHGVGIKLKYAYLDFKELFPIKDSKITIGLMKTYFGTIYSWDYTSIEKDPSDKYHFVSSTDYGMGFSGFLPKAFGSFNLAIYNGEGYKKTGKDLNKDFNYLANIRILPVAGLTLGASFMYKTSKDKEIPDTTGTMLNNPLREEDTQFAGIGKIIFGKFGILTQYLIQTKNMPYVTDYNKVNKTVLSIMPTIDINRSVKLVARYDLYDPDTNTDNDGKSLLLFGGNYYIMRDAKNNPKLFVQLNYEIEKPEDAKKSSKNTLMAQLRWIFSNKIK